MQEGEDLSVLREARELLLREDELTVGDDVELGPAALDGLRLEPFRDQLGRETRGPFVITRSGRAVVDLDAHAESLTFAPVIEHAVSAEDVAGVRGLFDEYQEALGVDLCFQGFDRELAELPGEYVAPRGCLLAVRKHGELVACVALRQLDAQTCEMKRLYVRASHRGLGLGRALAEAVIAEAKRIGYARMRLDTLPSMTEAAGLYERLGFREIEPYYPNPVPGARFLQLEL